jgi:hemerythrin
MREYSYPALMAHELERDKLVKQVLELREKSNGVTRFYLWR